MCEFLVRLIDKPLTGDVAVDCQRTRRGDVIAAVDDGWEWTEAERTEPEWIILKAPGISLDEGSASASSEPDDGSGRVLFWKRLFGHALDAAPESWTPLLAYPRAVESATITDPDIARAIQFRRDPIADPDVVGPQTRSDVIG